MPLQDFVKNQAVPFLLQEVPPIETVSGRSLFRFVIILVTW